MTRCVFSVELKTKHTGFSWQEDTTQNILHLVWLIDANSGGWPIKCGDELKKVNVTGRQQQQRRQRWRQQCSSFSAVRSAIKTAALRFPILKMSAAADAVLIATGCCAGAAAARRDTNYHQGKWPSHPQACCSRVPAHCTPSQCSQLVASRKALQRISQPRLEPKRRLYQNWKVLHKMLDSQWFFFLPQWNSNSNVFIICWSKIILLFYNSTDLLIWFLILVLVFAIEDIYN